MLTSDVQNQTTDSRWFYRDIVPVASFEDATSGKGLVSLPDDWWVVVTDVIGSTKAIEAGRYKDVNTVGAATIMAILNVDRSIPIPFIFGGDGATLAIPRCMTRAVKCALLGAQAMARDSFGLGLRIGLVPMSHLNWLGVTTAVGKFRRNDTASQASFSGAGWALAEDLIKSEKDSEPFIVKETSTLKARADFTGFECRWQPVPARKDHKLSILVKSLDRDSQKSAAIYNEVLNVIRDIYGETEDLHPLYVSGMKLSANPRKFWGEVRVRAHNRDFLAKLLYTLFVTLISLFSYVAFPFRIKVGKFEWGKYRDDVIENTDFRKFDGIMKMVVDGSDEQKEFLTQWLSEQERYGKLVFGLHQSAAAIVTCLIFSHGDNHTHFVDGSDGGYAMAAKQLKEKAVEQKNRLAGGAA